MLFRSTKDEQRNEVMSIIEDVNFVEDMIKLSGFEGFEKSLYTFLNTNDMAKNLIVSNILYDIKQLNDIKNIYKKHMRDLRRNKLLKIKGICKN